MPGTTPLQKWRYPFVGEQFRRLDIENLARDMDASLTTVRGFTNFALRRPRLRINRATAQSVPNNSNTTASFGAELEDTAAMWGSGAPTLIVPPETGLYWVDFFTAWSGTPASAPTYQSISIVTGGNTYLRRTFRLGSRLGLGGLIFLTAAVPVTVVLLQTNGAAASVSYINHRLSCQLLARCAVPLNKNPYFNFDAAGWEQVNNCTAVRSLTQVHEGVAALLITPTGGAQTDTSCEKVPLTAAATNTARCWVYSPTGWPTVSVVLDHYNAAGAALASAFGPDVNVPANTWTYLTVSGAAPANTVTGQLRVRQTGTPAAANILFVDDAWLAGPCP